MISQTFKKYNKFFLHFLLIYFFIPSLTGQVTQSDYNFTTINNENGLPNNNINDIVKDKQGFLWLATNDGLCRYESSNRLKIFLGNDPEIPTGLKSSTIRSLFADSRGNLWIGTVLGGLTRYHQPTETWTTFSHNPADKTTISHDEIICIQEDNQGRIWIGTEYGLNVFNEETETFTSFLPKKDDPNALNVKAILDIFEDDKGMLWIGTWDGGMYLMLPSKDGKVVNNKFRRFTINKDKQSDNVWKLYQDNQKRYWVGTYGAGLFLMDIPADANNNEGRQNWTPRFHEIEHNRHDGQTLSCNSIQDIYQDEYNHLWIGTSNGLNIIDASYLESGDLFEDKKMLEDLKVLRFKVNASDAKSLNNANINTILSDEQGIIWFGTFGGVSKYNWYTNQFDLFNFDEYTSENLSFPNFYVDKKGIVWSGSGEKGLYQFDIKKGTITEISELKNFRGNVISYLYSPDDIHLYLGTAEGIFIVNMETLKVIDYPFPNRIKKEIKGEYIRTLFKDSYSRIWIGAVTGLYSFNVKDESWTSYKYDATVKDGISDNSVTNVMEDLNKDIWITTFNGLNKIVDPKKDEEEITFEVFTYNGDNPQKSITSNRLVYLKEVGNKIYIGALSGISSYDLETKEITNYSYLQNKFCIHSIEKTKENNLWIGTTEGIVFFNTELQVFNKFQKEDGLGDITFIHNSSQYDSFGNLYFGTVAGITRFNPDNIFRNNEKPPVHITEARVMNPDGGKTINTIFQDEITLNHDDYYVSLSFAGLNYNRSEKNSFAYQLEGFDDKWIHTKTNLPVVYTNLDAGEYNFKVKASNNDGVWNEVGRTMKIIVKPAFWETWWFIGTNILFFGIALFTGIKIYNKRVLKHNLELTEYNDNLNREIEERKRVEIVLQERDQEMEGLVKLRTNQLEVEKAKVESLLGKIKARNEELERIVKERTQNLIDSNNELSRSNKDLEQFAYMASHDLQEPIRMVSNFVSLLGKKYGNILPDNAIKIIELTDAATGRMDKLIKSLLTYSKVGQEGMEFEMTDVKVMLQNKMLDLDQKIKEQNVDLRIGKMPEIFCEKNQLGMVFYNLVNNAIKFNKNGIPVVEIMMDEDAPDGFWKFSVKDNGIGIEEKYQKKIFEVFSRGEIWLKSEYGFGTTFFLTVDKNLEQKVKEKKMCRNSKDLEKSLYN